MREASDLAEMPDPETLELLKAESRIEAALVAGDASAGLAAVDDWRIAAGVGEAGS